MSLSDVELIEKIKSSPDNCSESYSELVSRHKNLYVNVAAWATSQVSGSIKGDLFEDQNYVLNLAIQSFDKDRNAKFSTWFANMAKWHCQAAVTKSRKENIAYYSPIPNKDIDTPECQEAYSPSLDEVAADLSPLMADKIDPESEYRHKERAILDRISEHEDPRIVEIAKLRVDGFKMTEIAKKLGITKEYCSHIFCRAIDEIFGANLNLGRV